MQIKKLLIVPGTRLSEHRNWRRVANKVARTAGLSQIIHEGELQYFGDISKILGRENVFYLNWSVDSRLIDSPEKDCPYPSCHDLGKGVFLPVNDLKSKIRQVDAVLISAAGKDLAKQAIKEARKNNKPIAILDRLDHAELYGSSTPEKDMYRGYVVGKDFDLYFKQDLLPSLVSDINYPISPLPVRYENYSFRELPKTASVFYSGRPRYEISQLDKEEIMNKVIGNIPNIDITLHTSKKTFLSSQFYADHLSQAFIALSPSCRVWDSFRHCEVGLSSTTALLAPAPYMATCGPKLKDGENAILYKTKLKGSQYNLNDPNIIERVQTYLKDPSSLIDMAKKWHDDVRKGHTVRVRSQYILDKMNQKFYGLE